MNSSAPIVTMTYPLFLCRICDRTMSTRVLAAMSGGVDSSVAALLLQQQGYDVVGATLNLWSYEGREEPYNECCSLEVRMIAHQLGIEHHFVDEGQAFKEAVVDPFIEESTQGLTPLPCAKCNRFVRVPKLIELADRLDCQYVATGHHVRIRQARDGAYQLLKGRDAHKDQGYFLYMLDQNALARLMVPIGDYDKRDVWKIAYENDLISARKPESQDLCFLPNGDARQFLKDRANGAMTPGEIVDTSGNVLGEHDGLAYYTIGQRRGLGVSAGEPVYVIDKDRDANRLIVGPEALLYSEGLIAEDVCFVHPGGLREPARAEVKIRYRSHPEPCTLEPTDDPARVAVRFDKPQRAVTPGQVAVFYQDKLVLGGGTIARAPAASVPPVL